MVIRLLRRSSRTVYARGSLLRQLAPLQGSIDLGVCQFSHRILPTLQEADPADRERPGAG